MNKVLVPNQVYEAFENVKKTLSHVNEDDLSLIFLNIFVFGRSGDLKILKEYAMKDPTKYLHALIYGYTTDKTEALKTILKNWLSEPYVEDEEKDVEMFAERITRFFIQQK